MFELTWSGATFIVLMKIIAIDIVLSGDNAIVIAMATRKLDEKRRNLAIFWGTFGAILLRILFAAAIAVLLGIPLVHFFGGLLLLWIAYKVLINNEGEKNVQAKDGFFQAVTAIIMADAVMSLDNVVAIAGASDGHILLIAIGVLISIPIMISGSKLIVKAMHRYPWIAYIGSGILAWTAGEMILKDEKVADLIRTDNPFLYYGLIAAMIGAVLFLGYLKNKSLENAGMVQSHTNH